MDPSDPELNMAFCDRFKRCISREVAANFQHGKGLAEGADWTTVFRHKRFYERGGKHGLFVYKPHNHTRDISRQTIQRDTYSTTENADSLHNN